jgi:hypothetical protein
MKYAFLDKIFFFLKIKIFGNFRHVVEKQNFGPLKIVLKYFISLKRLKLQQFVNLLVSGKGFNNHTLISETKMVGFKSN